VKSAGKMLSKACNQRQTRENFETGGERGKVNSSFTNDCLTSQQLDSYWSKHEFSSVLRCANAQTKKTFSSEIIGKWTKQRMKISAYLTSLGVRARPLSSKYSSFMSGLYSCLLFDDPLPYLKK